MEGAGKGGNPGLPCSQVTHLPIVSFANDFEEVKIRGPGTGARGRDTGQYLPAQETGYINSNQGFSLTLKLEKAMFFQPRGSSQTGPYLWGSHNGVKNRQEAEKTKHNCIEGKDSGLQRQRSTWRVGGC